MPAAKSVVFAACAATHLRYCDDVDGLGVRVEHDARDALLELAHDVGVLLLQGERPFAVFGPFPQDERLDDAPQGFGAELSIRNDDGLLRRLVGNARVDGRYIPVSKRLSWIGCTAYR